MRALLTLALFLTTTQPQEIEIPNRSAVLSATLRLPDDGHAPYPAVILLHGSGRVTAQEQMDHAGRRLAALGLAVLAYDKRGVGRSTGEYSNVGVENSVRMFDLLASDAIAAVQALKRRRDIDSTRIGLVGFSQGGWIAPLAASQSADVRFVVAVSGPAVSVGEEIAYSRLAGEDPGSEQGLDDDEIARRMHAFRGPFGFDPVPVLSALKTPSFWVLGEHDRSIPLRRTLDVLTRLSRERSRELVIHLIPGVNHRLMDPQTGRQPDFWRAIGDWLQSRGVLRKNL